MTEPSPPPSDVPTRTLTRISKTGVTRLKTGASKLRAARGYRKELRNVVAAWPHQPNRKLKADRNHSRPVRRYRRNGSNSDRQSHNHSRHQGRRPHRNRSNRNRQSHRHKRSEACGTQSGLPPELQGVLQIARRPAQKLRRGCRRVGPSRRGRSLGSVPDAAEGGSVVQ